ncbi:GNAT family N-acetyltransferase [Micromonospora coxensis]|uniref:Acetyltransferase, GNAT family n=1 Tax=Micromonospora coxensis TaxID=356852 RepID=A0A1C5JXA7_9ACTN|nr:GNAT family N-acetyltransferase [Micromonospora coxensis]SCG75210.1 Acetyltransferase, GNAT family [Micromonospora coxensis]
MVTVRLESMTDAQYLDYRERAEDDYADSIAASGTLPRPEARRKAREDHARLLPDGPATPGHHLWRVLDGDDGADVGLLWLHVAQRSDGPHAFVYDIEVHEQARRRGYGRAVMRAAERFCRDRGVVSIALNVFGHNTGARALYEQEGYQVTSVQMRKRL